MRSKRLFFTLAFGLSLLSQGLAWNDTGHMVIASIAYKHLSPTVKQAVDALLADGQPAWCAFVTSAVWADKTKNRDTAPWHYVDQYFLADGRLVELQPGVENVVWAIDRFSLVLKGKSNTKNDRAEALRYLIHFVGDIHQPLHCVSRTSDELPSGDRGGNLFKVRLPSGSVFPAKNLHAVWDFGGGLFADRIDPSNGIEEANRLNAIAMKLDTKYGSAARKSRETDARVWAKEGLKLSRASVYPESHELNSAFLKNVETISGKRSVAAGYRLAALLNQLLS